MHVGIHLDEVGQPILSVDEAIADERGSLGSGQALTPLGPGLEGGGARAEARVLSVKHSPGSTDANCVHMHMLV